MVNAPGYFSRCPPVLVLPPAQRSGRVGHRSAPKYRVQQLDYAEKCSSSPEPS
ncbi:hypothetical protein [Streptomyces tanashiensis]|uniref:hypothetical protein n=1 Tax=Streptomyces tanashiensis TaxID=67367 RepID=UPI003432DA11